MKKQLRIEIPQVLVELHKEYGVSYTEMVQLHVDFLGTEFSLQHCLQVLKDLKLNDKEQKGWRDKRDPANHFKWYKKYYAKNRRKIINRVNEQQKQKRRLACHKNGNDFVQFLSDK